MIKFFLVRHGETQCPAEAGSRRNSIRVTSFGRIKEEIFQGIKDIPLNKTGLNQARSLAQSLKNIPLDLVLSSPLKRARQTAQEISKTPGDPSS